MELFFLAIAASVSAASLVLWSRVHRAEAKDAAPPALQPAVDRTPLTLQVGDIVEHLDRDYLVEGALLLSETPRAARLCRLIDGAVERFLFSSTYAPTELWLLATVDAPPEAQAETLVHAGESLRLERRWKAASLSAGRIGRRSFDAELTVLEYIASTGRYLLVLQGPTRSTAFFGERILPHAIEILPGRG